MDISHLLHLLLLINKKKTIFLISVKKFTYLYEKNKTIPSSKITFRCLNNLNMNDKIIKILENNIGHYTHKFKESIY